MQQVDNISLKEYFLLPDKSQYDFLAEYLKPKNMLCGKICITKNFTFDEVEVFRRILSNPKYEDIRDMYTHCFRIKGDMKKSSEDELLDESIITFFRATNFIKEHLIKLSKREELQLSEPPDTKMEMIQGYERLGSVAHQLRKISIAQQFGLLPSQIGAMKYSSVFSILVANKKQRDVQQDYVNLK